MAGLTHASNEGCALCASAHTFRLRWCRVHLDYRLVLSGGGRDFGFFFLVTRFFEGAWFGYFAVSEGLYYFEDFGPGWEGSGVLAFVLVDGHQELELLFGHAAFFGGLATVTESYSGSASSVEAETSVNNTVSTFFVGVVFVILSAHISSPNRCTFPSPWLTRR